jgi:hypothetical protein
LLNPCPDIHHHLDVTAYLTDGLRRLPALLAAERCRSDWLAIA